MESVPSELKKEKNFQAYNFEDVILSPDSSDNEDDGEALLLEALKEKENAPAAKRFLVKADLEDSDSDVDLLEAAFANNPKPQNQPQVQKQSKPQKQPKPQNPPEAQNLPKPQKTSNKAAAPSTVATSKYHARKNELKFYESMAAMAVPVVPVKPLPKPHRSEPASNSRRAEMEAKKERKLEKRNSAIARKQAKEQAAVAAAQKRKTVDDCPIAKKIANTESSPSTSEMPNKDVAEMLNEDAAEMPNRDVDPAGYQRWLIAKLMSTQTTSDTFSFFAALPYLENFVAVQGPLRPGEFIWRYSPKWLRREEITSSPAPSTSAESQSPVSTVLTSIVAKTNTDSQSSCLSIAEEKKKRGRDACGICNKKGDKTCIVPCECHRWAHWDCITANEFWRCKHCINALKPKRPRKRKAPAAPSFGN